MHCQVGPTIIANNLCNIHVGYTRKLAYEV